MPVLIRLALALGFVLAGTASAQVPADVTWRPVGRSGSTFHYLGRARVMDEYARLVCLYRYDLGGIDLLGCASASGVSGQVVEIQFSMPYVPHTQAEIRGHAYDDEDRGIALDSGASENAARIRMSPPGKVRLE